MLELKDVQRFVDQFEKANIRYFVHAGYGLDGLAGKLTRRHADLDILCLKKDEGKIRKIIEKEGYDVDKIRNLLKLKKGGIKFIDIGLLVKEGGEYVSYGAIAETRFPAKLLKGQKGHIGSFEFTVASNALLKLWGAHSRYKNDRKFAESLDVDEEDYRKIKRKLYKP